MYPRVILSGVTRVILSGVTRVILSGVTRVIRSGVTRVILSGVEGRHGVSTRQITALPQKSAVKVYYVYMLLCVDGSFYVGVTNDLELRVGQHQSGFDRRCYTFRRRPLKLVHSSDFREVDDAIAWEKQLKGWTRAKKLALIENDWGEIHTLATCLNETAAGNFTPVSSFDSAQDDTGYSAQDDTDSVVLLSS